MPPVQIDSKIISNNKIAKNYYLLKLETPSVFKDARPGQFVHVKVNDSCSPLLRRPFSIHNISPVKTRSSGHKFQIDILYELKGKGTSLLSEKRAGECLDILGPLGTGFDYQTQHSPNHTDIIIAGGAGVAPLFFLASKLLSAKSKHNKVIALIGAATSAKILAEKQFKDLGCQVEIATEDGTRGRKGKVIKLFEKILSKVKQSSKSISVYACGPEAMLTELSKRCIIKKIPLQVSLEEFMGCGIGACLGCAIQTKTGYQRVCHDGPVFHAEDILWKF